MYKKLFPADFNMAEFYKNTEKVQKLFNNVKALHENPKEIYKSIGVEMKPLYQILEGHATKVDKHAVEKAIDRYFASYLGFLRNELGHKGFEPPKVSEELLHNKAAQGLAKLYIDDGASIELLKQDDISKTNINRVLDGSRKKIRKSAIDKMVSTLIARHDEGWLKQQLNISSLNEIYSNSETLTPKYGEQSILRRKYLNKTGGNCGYDERAAKQVCLEKICADIGIQDLDELRIVTEGAIGRKKKSATPVGNTEPIASKSTETRYAPIKKETILTNLKTLSRTVEHSQKALEAYIQAKEAYDSTLQTLALAEHDLRSAIPELKESGIKLPEGLEELLVQDGIAIRDGKTEMTQVVTDRKVQIGKPARTDAKIMCIKEVYSGNQNIADHMCYQVFLERAKIAAKDGKLVLRDKKGAQIPMKDLYNHGLRLYVLPEDSGQISNLVKKKIV
jgi:hypothetical protein